MSEHESEQRRRDYRGNPLERSDLRPDPHDQFADWFQEAVDADIDLPDATALATTDQKGAPSVRMVLLKEHGPDDFVFYTDYESRKGRELEQNENAALVLYWKELDRQVRLEGTVSRISEERSRSYFQSRPRKSQIAAHASRQSEPVSDRSSLEAAFRREKEKFEGEDVPLPENWGGYRLRANEFIFWQGRPGRLHDRFRYRKDGEDWTITRLSP